MRGWLVGLFLLAACPPAPLPTPRADMARPIADACPASMPLPVTADVCPGLFSGGAPCARCKVDGCFDQVDAVWCSVGPCASDPRCKLQLPDAR